MRIRLTRRLAACLNGVDLSRSQVGDILTLSERDAEMMLAEGWATAANVRAEPDVQHDHNRAGGNRPARRASKRRRR
jgi:hypothetical protein